jgi:hypothetical protein
MVIEGLLIRTCMGFEQIARLRTSFAAIRFNKITVKNMMQHVSFRTGISTSDEESFRYLGQGVEGDAERTFDRAERRVDFRLSAATAKGFFAKAINSCRKLRWTATRRLSAWLLKNSESPSNANPDV